MVLQVASAPRDLFFSPDGQTLVALDEDSGIQLWDNTLHALKHFIADSEIRQQPVFTADSKLLVSVWYNGDTHVSDVVTGQSRHVFKGFDEGTVVTSNGKLVAGSKQETLKIYNVRTGRLVRSFKQERAPIYLSADGKRLAVAEWDPNAVNTVLILDLARGKRLCTTGGATAPKKLSLSTTEGNRLDATGPVLFSPDGRTFATSGVDPEWRAPGGEWGDSGWPIDYDAKIWDIRTGKLLRLLKGWTTRSLPYAPLAFSSDGKSLVCGGEGHVDVWNLQSGKKRLDAPCSGSPVVSPDNSLVAFATQVDDNYFVEVHSVADGKLQRKLSIGKRPVVLALAPNKSSLVVGTDEPFSLTWWDWRTARRTAIATPTHCYNGVSSIVFSPDGTLLGTHYQDNDQGKALLWDVRSGRLVSAIEGGGTSAHVKLDSEEKAISVVEDKEHNSTPLFGKRNEYEVLSPDGTRAVVASRNDSEADEFLSVWDVAAKKLLWTRKSGKGTTINGMEISPDNKTVATSQPNERGDSPANFSVWDMATGQVRHVLDAASGSYRFVFSGDGHSVAGANTDGTIRVWDVWTGQLKGTVKLPTGYTPNLALSPDGTRLVSASNDGSLTLYEVSSGKALLRWVALVAPAGQEPDWLAITLDGYYSASKGAERYVRWRVGNQLFPVQKYRSDFLRPDLIQRILREK